LTQKNIFSLIQITIPLWEKGKVKDKENGLSMNNIQKKSKKNSNHIKKKEEDNSFSSGYFFATLLLFILAFFVVIMDSENLLIIIILLLSGIFFFLIFLAIEKIPYPRKSNVVCVLQMTWSGIMMIFLYMQFIGRKDLTRHYIIQVL
jgi:phosphatidylserine synthase